MLVTFGALLQKWRKRNGLKQVELARAGNIALITLSSYETGRRYPPPETVEQLAAALNLTPDERLLLLNLARMRRGQVRALPTPLLPCLGRAAEIDQITTLLRSGDVRCVTITGPVGVGKSRLAIACAQQLHDAMPDGVVYLDLAAAPVGMALPDALLAALRGHDTFPHSAVQPSAAVPTLETTLDLLVSVFQDLRLLLVLDTLEHLQHSEVLLSTLLPRCPRLKLLLTSRCTLAASGSAHICLEGLGFPDAAISSAQIHATLAEFPAVQMLRDRLHAFAPELPVPDSQLDLLGQICAAFDGLPLALELIAGWCHGLSPQQVLAYADQ
jgi:predicted ATPase/transcriptional regulator with XRE-family HTH domain